MAAPVARFDYGTLAPQARDGARAAAERIRLRIARSAQDIIEIGRDLIATKDRLGHGSFLAWIEAEFGMSERSAQQFVNVAEKFSNHSKSATVADLPASVLYELAAPSTTGEIIDVVVEKAQAGERVTRDDVKALKAEFAAERKALKGQVDETRLRLKEAKARESGAWDQLERARDRANALSDELQTARWEIEQMKRGAAERIRLRIARSAQDIIEVGRDLIATKKALGHGHFLPWIEAEFGMSEDTAERFMRVAKRLNGKIPHSAEFGPSVLYELAAPSTTGEIIDVVVEKAQAGERVTRDDVKALKAQRVWREHRGLALEELAARAGVPAERIAALEAGAAVLDAARTRRRRRRAPDASSL